MVYNSSFDAGDYCYHQVTFDNAWSGFSNDNVAFGDGSQRITGHDFYSCTGSDATSWDDEPSGGFDWDDADIGDWSYSYSIYYYENILDDDHAVKRLGYYGYIPPLGYYYGQNVGYDTDRDAGDVYKQYFGSESLEQPIELISLRTYPNPFNASISIEAPEEASIAIYNLSGQKIADIPSGTSVWEPDNNIDSGVYLVRVIAIDGQVATKNIIYLK